MYYVGREVEEGGEGAVGDCCGGGVGVGVGVGVRWVVDGVWFEVVHCLEGLVEFCD